MEKDNKCGTFYGVGIGPGDPELATVKAVRILEVCPVIAAPRTGGEAMVALDIAGKVVDLEGKTILPMDFTMDRDVIKRRDSYRTNADAAAAFLDRGLDVAMVNLGDVSIYSTYGYIADELRERGYETAMIPGITSFSAAAAALNINLTVMNEPLHIIPAVGTDPGEYLHLPGTGVVMKAGRHLPELIDAIREQGLLENTSLAVNCGMEGEILVENLGDCAELPGKPGYFTTVIIREKS